MLKKNKGITLIALVVTIIVLLILAGVTLAFVSGENGILKRATDAVKVNEKATAEEQADLLIADLGAQYYEKKYVEQEEGLTTIDEYLKSQLTEEQATDSGEHTVKIEGEKVLVFKDGKKISEGTLNNGKVIWGQSPVEGNQTNNDWKNILNVAGGESSNFNSYEEMLEDESVVESIISNEQAVDTLLNSNDEIIETTIKNENVLNKLATNEETAIKILNHEKWYEKIENSENSGEFFENINIAKTEMLQFVDGENPYYTFEAKANQSYFIQCFGAQGGSYGTSNPG